MRGRIEGGSLLKYWPQAGRDLFADENEDAGGQRHNIEQHNCRPKVYAEPQKAVDDQVNCEQKHADVFCDFHNQ